MKEGDGPKQVEVWLYGKWGEMAIGITKVAKKIILVSLSYENEVEEILMLLKIKAEQNSPLILAKRWMEVMGKPREPTWVHQYGILPLAWQKGVQVSLACYKVVLFGGGRS